MDVKEKALNKHTPAIRFEGFSGAWEEKKLGALADIVRGASPRPIDDPKWFDEKSNVGWLRIKDVSEQDGRIYYLEQRISKAGEEKTRVLTEPHLLLSIAASVGKPVVNYVNTGVHDGFLIFKKPIFYRDFLYQWLKYFEKEWQKQGQPGSQVNLNSEIVKNQNISIPKKKEQTKIGNYFQQLDTLIAQHQQKHDKLLNLKKSLLEKMFPRGAGANDELGMMKAEWSASDNSALSTHPSALAKGTPEIRFKGFSGAWEEKELVDFVFNISDGDWIESNHIFEHGKYRIIQTGNLGVNGEYIDKVNNAKYFHQKDFDEIRANEIFPNDILISRLAEPAGRTVVLPNTGFRMVTAVDVTVIRPDDRYNSIFLKTQLNTDDILHKVNKNVSGTSHKRISRSNLEKTKLMVPKLNEQTKIGKLFKNLDTLINQHQTQLKKLGNIKQACLAKMFV